MKQYRYDVETKEYIGEFDCQPSPLEEGVFLVSANCTLKKPTKAGTNKVNVFENGSWVKKDDYRGQEVEVLGQTIKIEDIGVTPESLEPTDAEKTAYEENQKLLEKQNRIAELKQLLRDTDYVVLPDYDQEKPDIIAQRALWREEVRALEND